MTIFPVVVFLIAQGALAVFLLVLIDWEEEEAISRSTTFLKPSRQTVKTYKWIRINDVPSPIQVLDNQIKTAIDVQLGRNGLAETEGNNADLYVAVQLAINEEKPWNN